MKKKLIIALFTAAGFTLLFYSCQKQTVLKTLTPHLPEIPYEYEGCSSTGGCVDNTPSNNHLTANGATLGRVLFYDPRLSLNNTVSCASCHKQEFAFGDNSAASTGYEGLLTRRNTPALINENAKAGFFWDGRSASLEEMVLMPVQHKVEMGMEQLDVMEKKIAAIDYYPALFQRAFGTPEVTRTRIARALAQFVRAMQSKNSKVDRNDLSAFEKDGRTFFTTFKCSQCHKGADFGGNQISSSYSGTSQTLNAANIGLDVSYPDKGIEELNGNAADDGAFIIPSLRNLQYTMPFAHDGRYKTIEDAIEHYNSGIQAHPMLDRTLIDPVTGKPVQMQMTTYQKEALAAFLRALSDGSVTGDQKFSNPFN